MSLPNPRQAAPATRRLPNPLLRPLAWLCPVLVLLMLSACDGPGYPQRCEDAGGHLTDRTDQEGFLTCEFPDGTECSRQMVMNRTCVFAGATPTPVPSPLPTFAPISPLGTPAVRYNPPSSIMLRAPGSLDALIHRAPLIFIGEVGPIEQYTEFETMETSIPYTDSAGNLVPSQPVINLLLPGMPMTEFRLIVQEVIRDDGKIAAGEPIILRSLGHITAESAAASQAGAVPATFTGDRYLFLLSPYPDEQAYAFYFNTWSRLIIDGDILRRSNSSRDPLIFDGNAGPITLEAFIEAVQRE